MPRVDSPDPIWIVCGSDLHDTALPTLPTGDILIVARGLSSDSQPAQLRARLDGLAALASASFEHVIVMAGTSDRALSPAYDRVLPQPTQTACRPRGPPPGL